MAIELVIFDCDGVLVDSEPIANRVLAACLTDAGFPVTYEHCLTHYVGLSMVRVLAMVAEEFGRPVPDGFLDDLQAVTNAAFRRDLQAMPGVHDAIATIQANHLKTCVASSGALEKMQVSLGVTGLWPLFEGRIFSASQVGRGKPAPDLFLFAAARMGVAPPDCVVIEDSAPGVAAALAAGMRILQFGDSKLLKQNGNPNVSGFSEMSLLPSLIGLAGPPEDQATPVVDGL